MRKTTLYIDIDDTIIAQVLPGSITVQVKQRLPTMMFRLVGIPDLTVSASATAEPKQP